MRKHGGTLKGHYVAPEYKLYYPFHPMLSESFFRAKAILFGMPPEGETSLRLHAWYEKESSRRAAADTIKTFLYSDLAACIWSRTMRLVDVPEECGCSGKGIDLLWYIEDQHRKQPLRVAITADQYIDSDCFFIETRIRKGKSGSRCLLRSRADWQFYYFINLNELYCLPLAEVSAWLAADHERHQDCVLQDRETRLASGKLVPTERLLENVPGAWQFRHQAGRWVLAKPAWEKLSSCAA